MTSTFAHLAVLVSDLERSTRFYVGLLGWEVAFDQAFDDGSLGAANAVGGAGRIRMGAIDGVGFELVEMRRPLTPRGAPDHYGTFLMSVRVPSLVGLAETATALGGEVRRRVPIGGSELLVIADPDGQEVGLIAPVP